MNAMTKIEVAPETASVRYEPFTRAITNASHIIDPKYAHSAVRCVLVTAGRGGLKITGSILDAYTTTFVPGSATPGFTCLMDCHRVLDILKKSSDVDTINFSMVGGLVTMTLGKLIIRMDRPAKVEDFPVEADFRTAIQRSNCTFSMPAIDLGKALRKISFAISTEDTRYYLNGIFMHIYKGSLVFVATDGHRLARYRMPIPAGAEAMPDDGVIIPRNVVSELERLVKRRTCPKNVTISVAEDGASFLFGDEELIETKAIDGTFPDYGRVMPTMTGHVVHMMPSLLIDAVTKASAVQSSRGRAVCLTLGDGWLRASCTDPDFGSSEVTVAAENETPLEVGVNTKYLLSILKNIEGRASMDFNGSGNPITILDAADDRITYVQMPMRV